MTYSAPTPAPTSARRATSREFFAVLFRRKWIILALFFITTLTVTVIALTTPVHYQSSGRVLVNRGERESLLSPGRQVFNEWEQELGSEMEVVKGYPVLTRARQLIAEDNRRTGHKAVLDPTSLDVEVMGKSDALAIGYSDRDPDVAQEVCDAVVTSYVAYRRDQLTNVHPESFFETELAGVERQISDRLDERSRYSEATGVQDAQEQGRALTGELGFLEQRRNDISTDMAEAQSSLLNVKVLRDNPDVDLPTMNLGMTTTYTNEPALVALKQKILDQQARIASLSERYQDDAPEIENAKTTLATLQALLRREVDARVMMSEGRIATLQAKLNVVNHDLDSLQRSFAEVPRSFRTLSEIDADVSALREREHDLQHSRDLARITANTSQNVSVTLLSPAGPATPINPLDPVRLALAPAFSLVVGIALAFFIDGLDLTVRTATQAEETTELPVLASLAERRSRRG